jgi:hypothetical protein
MSTLLRSRPLRTSLCTDTWRLCSLRRTHPFNARHLASTPWSNLSQPPSPDLSKNQNQQTQHDECGLVIYRCAYNDDQAWNRFKQTLEAQTQETIAFYKDTAEANDSLEWTFVENRATLEGASKDYLRKRFKQARSQTVDKDQSLFTAEGEPCYSCQNRYFIQVDEQSLQDLQDWGWAGGSVNFVDADWRPLRERLPAEKISNEEFEFDPVEGCTEEHVGWMKIAGPMINRDLCGLEGDQGSGMDPELWYVYYVRPDDILYS